MPRSVKRPSPLSIRLSEHERAQLAARAGQKPIGGYVKGVLFGTDTSITARRMPAKESILLAQIVAVLGKSRIAPNLDDLASAARSGSLDLDLDTIARIDQACGDIRLLRKAVMHALGKQDPEIIDVAAQFRKAAGEPRQ